MTRNPTMRHRDGVSIGELARHWQKPIVFVRRMISEDKLAVDDRGVVTQAALHTFMRQHATELD